MSERMTSIALPGVPGSGIQDYGRQTPEHMLKMIQEYALYWKNIADSILEASEEDFRIETYIGSLAQNKKEIIREGRKV